MPPQQEQQQIDTPTPLDDTTPNKTMEVEQGDAEQGDIVVTSAESQPRVVIAGMKCCAAPTGASKKFCIINSVLGLACVVLLISTIVLAVDKNDSSSSSAATPVFSTTPSAIEGENPCAGMKPELPNVQCIIDHVAQTGEQAGADVTAGYVGGRNTTAVPITEPYFKEFMCPVNVHWHLGAEHRSKGEFDEKGTGPSDVNERRRLAGETRQGFQCRLYDENDSKFTKAYNWQHCIDMEVGQTYEVHWPHSAAGACGTPNQYQTPFYDGVFCNMEVLGDLSNTAGQIGVQAQVFTIVNDESYYYPDLMRGMIVDGDDFGSDMAMYTGSTTGTSRDNEICSQYSPITWQVDRKCHLVSASSFDKMCADMKAQRDDMSDDLYAHGSRELVNDAHVANNQQNL